MRDKIIEERKRKLQILVDAGVNPYPAVVKRTHAIIEFLSAFSGFLKNKKQVSIVGRIRSVRNQGNIVFIDIQDGTSLIQVILKKEDTKNFKFIKKTIDNGDFLSVSGKAFMTKQKQKSIITSSAKIISKALRPIPSDYYGIEDKEIILRKRYLDTILNEETKDIFIKKSIFWKSMRDFLNEEGFLEVDTPVLEQIPGGAEAEPFVTHHNALDQNFYLRISLEIALKKMMIGGFDKIYEIGKVFRNEGIDAQHLQDYTQMEFYWAYANYKDLMKIIEKMYKYVIKKTFGTLKLKHDGIVVDWGKKWKVVDYVTAFKKANKLDPLKASKVDLYKKAVSVGAKPDRTMGRGRLIDLIYKKTVRPKLIQPTFLANLPVEISPLAKRFEDNKEITQRIQILAYGTELGNGFSELNDPIDQRKRLENQMALRKEGDKEAQMLDESFIEAMEYGMPPAAGFGLSERLFAVLINRPIREIVFLPPMKKETNNK